MFIDEIHVRARVQELRWEIAAIKKQQEQLDELARLEAADPTSAPPPAQRQQGGLRTWLRLRA